MYLPEKLLLGFIWIISFISVIFIPKQKYRQASFIFILSQLPAWILGLFAVEAGLIEYPARELQKANATSFTFEFLFLPFLCIFFNIFYPEGKSITKKVIHYVSILGTFTLIEYVLERFTLLIKYLHWEWYITFLTMSILFYFVRVVYKWFFKINRPFAV